MYVMVLFVDFYLAGDTRQENRRQHISVSASGTLCIQTCLPHIYIYIS